MSHLAAIVAQGEPINAVTGLYVYGPLGVISGFFMLVSYKLIGLGAKLVEAIKADNIELRLSIRTLAHRLDGLQRALLADMVERDTCGPNTKEYARSQIARIDARDEDTRQ